MFLRSEGLWAAPFDAAGLTLTGEPRLMAQNLRRDTGGFASYAVSSDGTLAYLAGFGGNTELVWVDRNGREERLGLEPAAFRHPRISPDGTRVAVSISDGASGGSSDIHVYDLGRGVPSLLTYEGSNTYPVWLDGDTIVFASTRDSGGVFMKAADGTGEAVRLTARARQFPFTSSVDGEFVIVGEINPETRDDLLKVPIDSQQPPEPVLQTRFDEEHAALSPDGRRLAYTSDESGTEQIHVRAFPDVADGGRVTVSVDGGREPVWARDGSELFYVTSEPAAIWGVSVQTEPTFQAGTPQALFQGPYVFGAGVQYHVHPDGQRFLLRRTAGSEGEVMVVLNWSQELLERVPIP